MEGNPYQPPLLNLHDMLNFDNDDDATADPWTSNPYNISNFFEPIAAASKATHSRTSPSPHPHPTPGGQVKEDSGVISLDFLDCLQSPPKKRQQQRVPSTSSLNERFQPVNVKREEEVILPHSHSHVENELHLEMADLFTEDMVTSQIEESGADAGIIIDGGEQQYSLDSHEEHIPPDIISPCSRRRRASLKTEDNELPSNSQRQRLFGSATLKEVKLDDLLKEDLLRQRRETTLNKCRDEAVDKLDSLINTLKRFSIGLQQFLDDEGQTVVDYYHTKKVLSGILPDDNPSSSSETVPFDLAHSLTQAIVSHTKGHNVLGALTQTVPQMWCSSDLLLLQKSVLESVIERREFFLRCRYSQLLTEMGFDEEDLDKLSRCPTKAKELAELTVILEEHNFESKLKDSRKKPIQRVILREKSKWVSIPHFFSFPSPKQLVEDKWRALLKIRQKTVLSTIQDEDIDWMSVTKKMMTRGGNRNADEANCKLTYDHLISFKFNNSPWHFQELLRLRELHKKHRNASWEELANLLGTRRTPFACFVKFKTHCMTQPDPSYTVPRSMYPIITEYLQECVGNVVKVDYKIFMSTTKHYKWLRPGKLLALSHQILNPRYRKGRFSIVEDALLMVVMERHKEQLLESDHDRVLDSVAYALPWRHATMWRARIRLLLTAIYRKQWTLEEDRLLMTLVQNLGPNYKLIQRSFPQKDRKRCRHRYVYLSKILNRTTLEDYHMFHKCGRGNFSITKLKDIAEYLNISLLSKLKGKCRFLRETDLEFLRLRRAPKDSNLDDYVLSFPLHVIASALNRLSDCLVHILEKWDEARKEVGHQAAKFNFDSLLSLNRRKFDAACPASTASALHRLNARLVPPELLGTLTKFESDVYLCHKFFLERFQIPKKRTRRGGIPPLDTLRKISTISRIIEPPPQKPSQPSVIVKGKGEHCPEEEDSRILQELADQQKGGALKGMKRKSTMTREAKKRAARARWEKEKNASTTPSLKDSISEVNSPYSWDVVDRVQPCTPMTPTCADSSAEDSTGGASFIMRNAALGFISDHAYIHPMDDPCNSSRLPLNQLFEKMGFRFLQPNNMTQPSGNV